MGHDQRAHIAALVVARGRCGRFDPLTPVGGVPMVVRAVSALLDGIPRGAADRCAVLGPPGRCAAYAEVCADLPVDVYETFPAGAHTGQRAGPAGGDGRSGLLVMHDALRPLTPPALVASVVEAALARMAGPGPDAVVPVLPLTDTVKLVDTTGLVTASPDRTGLRVLQTPHVLRGELLGSGEDPLTAAARLAACGSVQAVAGDPMAFPVLTDWDLELAELLAAGVRA